MQLAGITVITEPRARHRARWPLNDGAASGQADAARPGGRLQPRFKTADNRARGRYLIAPILSLSPSVPCGKTSFIATAYAFPPQVSCAPCASSRTPSVDPARGCGKRARRTHIRAADRSPPRLWAPPDKALLSAISSSASRMARPTPDRPISGCTYAARSSPMGGMIDPPAFRRRRPAVHHLGGVIGRSGSMNGIEVYPAQCSGVTLFRPANPRDSSHGGVAVFKVTVKKRTLSGIPSRRARRPPRQRIAAPLHHHLSQNCHIKRLKKYRFRSTVHRTASPYESNAWNPMR